MAALTVVTPTPLGVNPGPVSAAAGGDSVANPRGSVLVRVTNGGGTRST